MDAPVLDRRLRDWDHGNLFFQAVLGLASWSEDLEEAVARYVPGAPAPEGSDAVAADDPWVLALLGALRVKGLVDRALAEGAVESEESAPASGEEPALRSLLRG